MPNEPKIVTGDETSILRDATAMDSKAKNNLIDTPANKTPAGSIYPDTDKVYSPDELDQRQRDGERQAAQAMANAKLDEINKEGIRNPGMTQPYHIHGGGGNYRVVDPRRYSKIAMVLGIGIVIYTVLAWIYGWPDIFIWWLGTPH
jgi:hypothetical protein